MREELKKRDGRRGRFTAQFVRFGQKSAYKGPPLKTILLRDVKDEAGNVVTDHLWFTQGKQFEALQLAPGDIVQFEARVRPYKKGYRGHREEWDSFSDVPPPAIDYRLALPTKVKLLGRPHEAIGSFHDRQPLLFGEVK